MIPSTFVSRFSSQRAFMKSGKKFVDIKICIIDEIQQAGHTIYKLTDRIVDDRCFEGICSDTAYNQQSYEQSIIFFVLSFQLSGIPLTELVDGRLLQFNQFSVAFIYSRSRFLRKYSILNNYFKHTKSRKCRSPKS